MTVEVTETKKDLNIMVGLRAWPVGNGLNSSRIHTNTSLVNEKSKIFHFGLKELAFLWVSI